MWVLWNTVYYAFGQRWNNPSGVVSENKFLYNGKESQEMFGLGWLDYGARMYDPEIPRWLTQDPLAENYYSTSPYAYVRNNPIRFIDPDGKRIWPVDELYKGVAPRNSDDFGVTRPRSNHPHGGVDINIGNADFDLGAPVYATHEGTVVRVAHYTDDKNGGGSRVMIEHRFGENGTNSVSTFYMHLNSIDDGVYIGAKISEGQTIGTIGGSGKGKVDEFMPHLHYEMFRDGARINPADGSRDMIDPTSFFVPAFDIQIPAVVIPGHSENQMPTIKFREKFDPVIFDRDEIDK